MADLERLSRALKAAHAAGDTVAAAKLAQAIRAAQAVPAGDTSMGTAARLGDLDAQISGREGMAGLNRLVSNSFIGDIQRAGREYIANPIRENVFNLPPIDTDQVNRQFEQNALTQADTLRAERDRIAEERNFQNLTTDDINDVPSFVNFVTQKLAQSAPQMAVSAASFNYATYPFMMGNLVETQEDIEGLSQAEKDAAAAKGAVIMTALETLGLSRLLPDGMSSSIIGGIANGAVSEGVTEGLQELVTIGVEHNAGKKFTQEELLSRLKESVAAGAAAGGSIKGAGNTATKTVKIFSSDGNVNNPDNMSAEGAAAAGAFARRLREIAQTNNYDLKDVNANSTKGARETVDKAHIQLAEELKKVFKDLGELVTPDKLKTFIETKDQILAQAAYREARNKTKSTVGQQELDAMRRLVGDTAEGQQAINLMLQLNQLTEVHNAGYKGGLSRITDVFNPLDQNINSYDTASRVVTGTLSPLATAAGAVSTGGASLAPQAALFGTGRAVDAMTGRRSTVDRFVRRNEGNSPDLPAPTAPSLVETKRLQEQQAQDEAQRNQEQQKQLNLQLAQQGAPATPGSPQFTMEDATGLSRDGVARILRVLKGRNDNPALIRAIQEYEQSVATGGRIEDLSPLIRAVRQFQEQNPDYVPMVRPPNSLSNPMLANPAAPGQTPNVDTTEANPVQAQTFGPQLTTQENYNRGIEANQAMNAQLVEGVTTDPELNRVQKGRLITSLDVLANNLGSDPVAAAQEQVQKLEEAGVPQEAIDTYIQPYVDRVARQQAARVSPDEPMLPDLDVPTSDPKKPQAPRLAPDQIPTQTRKVFKLMKVQKSRPGEVLPLFAKSGGDKGPASGYTFGEWFGSEFQRPKLGSKLLSPRSGIHAVNLPVFDQGKAKVKGQQRVWVEVEVPAVNPETQALSDNSFNPQIGRNEGILNRVLEPNESYDYKTNPNASNDAGGWPVTGSMKVLRIVPDNEIAQILRDNGLDHQIENSFTDVDQAKAQQLMQADEPILASINPDIPAPTTVQTAALSAPTPVVHQQINAPEGQTNHGLLPHLRVKAPTAREGKPLVLAGTNNKNASRQIDGIDEVLARHEDPAGSPEAWASMMGDAMATDDVPVQPHGFIEDLNNGGAQELLSTLTPGQIADADHGFRNAAEFRQAYINGEIGIEDTGRLFLWSFLSRGVSPYTQEGLFMDSFNGIEEWIRMAAGKSNRGTLADNIKDYEKWAKSAAPKGSGQPGAGATHNLNAFGNTFLMKMSQDAGKGDGRSRLQVIHDMMSDPNTTGKEVRREFLRMGEGVGIDNKVVSFTLLVAGYDDVMVLDRVQMRQMWNDGRFSGINLYDGYKSDGKPVTGSALSSLTYGARGLLVYEAMEKSLQNRLAQIYSDVGRPEAASVGRYHWETWVASSQQEASHGTIDAILKRAKGDPNPLEGVTAKEGEYGAYAYGARYGIENGVPMFTYEVPGHGEFKFTVPDFQKFLEDIKKPKNKVVPTKFKVTESGNAPWYTREGVNLDALAEKAKEHGKQIRTANAELQQGPTVPDGRTLDAPSGEPILGSRSPIESILGDTSPGANPDGPRPDVIPAEKPQVTPEQYKKAVVELIRPQFQIGLKGGELEDGISNFNDAVEFAKKLGIVVRLAMSQNELNTLLMLDTGQDPAKMGTFRGMFQRKGPKKQGKGTEGTIWAMKPGADKGDGTYVTDIEALTTLLHEISHAITLGPLDGKSDQEVYSYFINRKQSSKPGTGIVGRSDFTAPGSFTDSAIKPLLDADWEQMSPTQKKAYAEIVDLQENVEAYSPKNPNERRAVRFIRQVMSNSGYSQETKQAYKDYTRMAAEFAVDPVWVYLINPKLAKKLMPVTSKMIQQEFRKANNKVIQFYAHPLAVVMAALVALEMAMDDDEERRQQQMPPGALNAPMAPGMLSQA